MKYFVEVVDMDTEEVIHRIDCGESDKKAEKVQSGVDMRADLTKYYTRIVIEKTKKPKR